MDARTRAYAESLLASLAQARRPRVARWYGVRGTSSVRSYVCYLCDVVIDYEAAKWRSTRHAERAVEAHFLQHWAALPDDEKAAVALRAQADRA